LGNFASDDGSTDDTLDILKEYQARLGKNKLHIIRAADLPGIFSRYYRNVVGRMIIMLSAIKMMNG
jgi:glycosyltransferase involved in cell wall biosynthesis